MAQISALALLKKNLTNAVAASATAVRKAKVSPERAGFLVASAVNIASSATGASKIRKTSKLLLMPLLAAGVWRERDTIGGTDAKKLIAALGFGWLGDAVLLPVHADLNRGAIPFSINHVFYQYFVYRAGARPVKQLVALFAPPWAGLVVATKVFRPEFLPSTTLYGGLLGLNATIYNDPVLTENIADDADPRHGLAPGGMLFIISDTLLVTRAFVGEEKKVAQVFDAALMLTYAAAQLLIADGVAELCKQRRSA